MGRERIVSLQILRFVAAMMVVVYHCVFAATFIDGPASASIPRWVSVGPAGVDIFFVLSGFVIAMTGPLAIPRPSGALFFWRRWRRVAPVYFVLSAAAVFITWRAAPLSLDRLAATFLFWPVLGAKAVEPYISPGWTLCFEMVFYSTVALLLVGGRLRRNLLLGALALGALIVGRAWLDGDRLRFLVNPIFLEFAAGVGLAALRGRLTGAPSWLGAFLLVSGVGAFVLEAIVGVGDVGFGAFVPAGRDVFVRDLLFGVPGVAVVAGAIVSERWCRGAAANLLAKAGDASYMIYLTQVAAIEMVVGAWRIAPGPLWLFVLAGSGTALAVGVICHRVVEQPILRDLKRLKWPSRRAPVTAPAL